MLPTMRFNTVDELLRVTLTREDTGTPAIVGRGLIQRRYFWGLNTRTGEQYWMRPGGYPRPRANT